MMIVVHEGEKAKKFGVEPTRDLLAASTERSIET
jgi:hypothetical protein